MGRNNRRNKKKKAAQQAAAAASSSSGAAASQANGADSRQARVEALKLKGNRAFGVDEFKKAIDFYSEAIELDEKNQSLWSNRSAAHAAKKDYALALKDAEKAIELAPEWAKGYLRKGTALESLLDYPAAMAAYREGLARAPEDPALGKAVDSLSKMMQELKLTEEQLVHADNPEADKFDTMCKWLKDGGAQFPMLYLQYYSEDYRGVHCLTKVPNDSIILYVPKDLIMTSEVARASDIGKAILRAKVDLRSKHSFLASYLLEQKHLGRKSRWWPYIEILPQKYRNMPIFFDEDELKWLKGSFSLDKIADRIESLQREYDNIFAKVPEFRRFTHEEFVWARLVVITRIFGLVIDGKKTDGLVPYADMLNHKRPRETKWTFDDNSQGFTITTLRTVQLGEEVFDSYGRKCNSRFFVNYGFSIDNNDDNEAVLRIALDKSDPQYNLKVRMLARRDAELREFQIPANYKEKKTKELFSYTRLVHAHGAELMFLTTADGKKIEEIEPISVENEIKVLKHLKQAAQTVMAGFDTTLEDDEKLLAENPRESSTLPNNLRNALVMRTGEKRVLQWFIDLADKCVPMLQMPWKDLKRIAAKAYQSTNATDAYITVVVVPLVKKAN